MNETSDRPESRPKQYIAIITVDSDVGETELHDRLNAEFDGASISVERIVDYSPGIDEGPSLVPPLGYPAKCPTHPDVDLPCPLYHP